MTETQIAAPKDFGWVFLELMGHRQRIGRAREEEVAGGMMLRIDIPTGDDDGYVTEYCGTSSIYAMCPISEDMAMQRCAERDPRPVRPSDYRPASQIEAPEYEDDGEPCY